MEKEKHFALRLQEGRCVACGLCVESCAYGALRMGDYPEISQEDCRLCGSCVQACPAGALEMERPQGDVVAPKASGVWVWAEEEQGTVAPVTKELLGKAAALAAELRQPVEAVVVTGRAGDLPRDLIAYGADRVHVVESLDFSAFLEENHTRVLAGLVRKLRPSILLVGTTQRGRGLSARLAAVLQTGLTADCTELAIDPESGLLRQVRPAFGGNLMATIVNPVHRPQMASVRPGVMRALEWDALRQGEVVFHEAEEGVDTRVRLLSVVEEAVQGASWADSRIIVGIGRGVKTKERADAIRSWAERIGAVVAGSRAAVEDGLVDASLQVGQTGHTVAPDLYVAIGISGQIQHTAAITGAGRILAINPDRTAPIFGVADYGWAVRIEEALPELMNLIPEGV